MAMHYTYDFDKINDRRGTNSLKWDVDEREIPMWVADMDFQTAPDITEAIMKRARSGIYGYNIIPDAWHDAITSWWDRRHDFTIEKDWLIFCTGVVPAITCAVKRMTNVGDNVLVQTPVYDIFFHSIENQGRHVLENPLKYDKGSYSIDFEDLEEKLSYPQTTLMILCNPHNPVGKIWNREELAKIGALCAKHHVAVVSDEIHCDITEPGMEYLPFASVSKECRENSITCISATKTFNMAGLQTAAVVIPNKRIFEIMERGLNSDEVAEPNTFAIDTVIAAFTKGEKWLEELRAYIGENRRIVDTFLKEQLPEVVMVASHATYLLWLDCSAFTEDATELCQFIREKTGLYLLPGSQYRGNGKSFIRMNVACPKSQVLRGLKLLSEGVKSYREEIL